MQNLHRVSIYQALNKPNLFLGADRELMMFSILISCVLIFGGLTLITISLGIIIQVICGFFLRMMAKVDPLLKNVFQRQNKYEIFYYSQSTPFAYEKD